MRGPGRVVRGLKVAARTGRGLGLVVLGACGSGSGTAPGGGGGTAVAPSITAQPASASVVAGSAASFSVTASGTAPLSYQWREGGTNISGATSASYTTPATSSDNNGELFSVVVTNSAGSVTSSNATLTVTTAAVAPSITAQPANATVAAGQTATFSVTASGTAPLSYQWRKGGTNISGATSASYTTPATSSANTGELFSVVVTNSAGSVTSSNATLTVTTAAVAPSITTQPANATVTAGQTATFSVTASGTTPLSYQWRRGGTNISGATSASYTLQNTTSSDNGAQFSVVVTNSAGSVTSSNATLTVTTGTSLFPATIQLSTLNGTNGFRIPGAAADQAGYSVSDAGDVNGDGIDDFIVGATGADVSGINSGAAYVVFGKTGGFGTNLNLSTLNGTTGFRISGEEKGDFAGFSVSAAGDVNNDGYDDLLVGATGVSTNGKVGAYNITGAAYVVFGKASGFTANLNLSTLNGTNGFQLFGIVVGEGAGYSVSSAGDINGDGFDDVIVGASGADAPGTNSGAAYVVFGKASGFAATFSASSLTGPNGFRITGAPAFARAGQSVSGAGDINGDNIDDLIVGSGSGAYVVFGQTGGFAANLNLSTLNGTTGFRIIGASATNFGQFVSVAGDVNGDGIDDLIIGEDYADFGGDNSGAAYVVFGKVGGFGATLDVSTLTGANGFRLTGVAADDYAGSSVSGAGDINGDGLADLIVGAYSANPNGPESGAAYVVFGKAGGFAATLNLSGLTGANGFRIAGVAAGDYAGWSPSAAGDVNGDGVDDLIVGAWTADVNGSSSGAAYVIYGKKP